MKVHKSHMDAYWTGFSIPKKRGIVQHQTLGSNSSMAIVEP